jgi:hypothetical protein
MCTLLRGVCLALIGWSIHAGAVRTEPPPGGIRGQLTILTRYPVEMTRMFQHAFQQYYPGVKVLVTKKKTVMLSII